MENAKKNANKRMQTRIKATAAERVISKMTDITTRREFMYITGKQEQMRFITDNMDENIIVESLSPEDLCECLSRVFGEEIIARTLNRVMQDTNFLGKGGKKEDDM